MQRPLDKKHKGMRTVPNPERDEENDNNGLSGINDVEQK